MHLCASPDVEGVSVDLSESPDGGEVGHDTRLVVGGPATVEAVAAQSRLVGMRLPRPRVPRRLHVVMGVEQHRRATGACGTRCEHRRVAESSGLAADPIEGAWLNELNYLAPRAYVYTPYWGQTADPALRKILETVILDPNADIAATLATAAQDAQTALDDLVAQQ